MLEKNSGKIDKPKKVCYDALVKSRRFASRPLANGLGLGVVRIGQHLRHERFFVSCFASLLRLVFYCGAKTHAATMRILNMPGRCTIITDLMINEQIRDKEVRLIDSDNTQLGIVSGRDAQQLADDKKLDLVKISPTAKPPVCKIMDYSKYRFEQSKKEKEARKKQRTIDLKELRLSPNIDTHDVEVKVRKAIEFLKGGDKVKVTIRFRGRELGRTEVAYTIMNDFAQRINEYGNIDKPPKMEARTMAMFLTPIATNK